MTCLRERKKRERKRFSSGASREIFWHRVRTNVIEYKNIQKQAAVLQFEIPNLLQTNEKKKSNKRPLMIENTPKEQRVFVGY